MNEKFFGRLQTLRQKIRDDINIAKNPYEILLDVIQEIGEITGEENFYPEVRDDIISVYGHVLNEEKILIIELQEISARRQKIQAALVNPNFSDEDKSRIKNALDRHDAEIKYLQSLIADKK